MERSEKKALVNLLAGSDETFRSFRRIETLAGFKKDAVRKRIVKKISVPEIDAREILEKLECIRLL